MLSSHGTSSPVNGPTAPGACFSSIKSSRAALPAVFVGFFGAFLPPDGVRGKSALRRSPLLRHCERKRSNPWRLRKDGLLPPTRNGASADSKPDIARGASDGGSSLTLLAMTGRTLRLALIRRNLD